MVAVLFIMVSAMKEVFKRARDPREEELDSVIEVKGRPDRLPGGDPSFTA